jgi:hypothetical protein
MRAVGGKDYSPAQASTCGELIGSQVIECLQRTGTPHVEPRREEPRREERREERRDWRDDRGPTSSEVRAEIAAALEQLRARDVAGAEARLKALLRAMR